MRTTREPHPTPPEDPVRTLGCPGPGARTEAHRLHRLRGSTVLVKAGGRVLDDPEASRSFAQDLVTLWRSGIRPVVVHGGGPQIDAHLKVLGLRPEFVRGLRVTTAQTMRVVRMVLAGQVQRELVGLLNAHGPLAVGMTGEDANTLTAVRRSVLDDGEPVDIGLVGEITEVDDGALRTLLADHRIPVVSSLARGADGVVYNVNADLAAAALATALRAEALVLVTDVPGLYAHWPDPTGLIPRLTADEAEELLPSLAEGMAPKVEACVRAVRSGVPAATILDGRAPHALLAHFCAEHPYGTTVEP
ncbi:acetylglutamate kinase [Kitasatospora xanthocidica]|uniref:acetylglutamate kinase n=1 Tax=Kitasatospora xanthocidica TaxID=83382 RepID=UPI0036F0B2D3